MMDAKPKCVRVIVTAVYSDNSSVMIDVKDPSLFRMSINQKIEDGAIPKKDKDLYSVSCQRIMLEAEISPTHPVIVSEYPVKDQ